jgi:hypothetical protein
MKYAIKISGYAWNVEANSPAEAIEQIKNHAHVYCHFQANEIGKDVDEKGWPITTQTKKDS